MLYSLVRLSASLLTLGFIMMSSAETVIVAHRGNSSESPENTLASIRSALAMDPRPAYVEIDLHRSLDGVLVVSHDDDTLRITGVPGMIRERPFAELRKLDAGYRSEFGDAFKGEFLPRLEEILDAVRNTPVGVMIECKQLLLEEAVVSLLRNREELGKHVLASFDELTLYRARQLEPKLRTLYLVDEVNPTVIWRAKDISANTIGTNKKTTLQSIRDAHSAGLVLWVWTVDDPTEMTQWIQAGVDGLITNKPAVAIRMVKSRP